MACGTKSAKKMKRRFIKEYGKKKGTEVYYAWMRLHGKR